MKDLKKVVTVIGARPQFIKAAVVSRYFQEEASIEELIVHTGQHYDRNMSEVFFEQLQIPKPKYNLQVANLNHGAMTGQMLEGIEEILINEKPDAVLVYGDTNSTLSAALAAKKLHIKLIHIEAGLRSFNMSMPEEINRILTDRISDLLCCPTQGAMENLKLEGFDKFSSKIVLTGDIMKESVDYFSQKTKAIYDFDYCLLTVHRQENTEDRTRLTSIFKAMDKIAESIAVICPLHPRTRKKMQEFGIESKVTFIDPVDYVKMQSLIHFSEIVITDSGGLQKEAYFHKKFCIVLRDQTEWTELLSEGYAKLAGANKDSIITSYQEFMDLEMDMDSSLYGDQVGSKIFTEIKNLLWE